MSSQIQVEKASVQTQIELNEKFCQSNGYTLLETYVDDGVSGTTHLCDRPAGAKLLSDARAGKFEAPASVSRLRAGLKAAGANEAGGAVNSVPV